MKAFLASVFLFVLLCNQNQILAAESASRPKFIRMNIEVTDSGVRLIRAYLQSDGMNVREQKLEQRNDPFLYRAISDEGDILYEDTFRDPRLLFFDEPDETGLLHGGTIQNKGGVTSLTIPFSKKTMRVDFFQRQQQSSEDNLLASTSLKQFGSISVDDIEMSMQTRSRTERVPPVRIQKTGRPQNRIDMLFLAEGFTSTQRTLFIETVRDIVATWKRMLPWSEYFRLLNIYAVPLVSQDEGADHPDSGIFKDTALDAAYDCLNVSYLICIDYDKALSVAAESLPAFDYAFAVVNDPEYGGSGGVVSVFSLHGGAKEIFFHEIGHTFASLGDEYIADGITTPPFSERLYPNITKVTNKNRVKWKHWIRRNTPVPTPETLDDVIGIFQGALFHPTLYYRPKADCLMRTLGVPFDSVCAEAHILQALDLISLIDSATPGSPNITVSMNGTQTFKVKPAPIPFERLQFQWFVDGTPLDHNGTSLTLSGSQLPPGAHQLRVRVKDISSLIENDREELRSDSFTWNITIH